LERCCLFRFVRKLQRAGGFDEQPRWCWEYQACTRLLKPIHANLTLLVHTRHIAHGGTHRLSGRRWNEFSRMNMFN
jgi:hypothetical protein